VDSSQITIRGDDDDDDDDPTHHPMTPASPYPPYPNLVIFNLSRGTSLRPAPAAHVPCYHAEKLRQQLQAKQQAVQASSTASAEPGEIVLVADVAGFLIWSGNWIWVTIPSRTFQIGELLQLIHWALAIASVWQDAGSSLRWFFQIPKSEDWSSRNSP